MVFRIEFHIILNIALIYIAANWELHLHYQIYLQMSQFHATHNSTAYYIELPPSRRQLDSQHIHPFISALKVTSVTNYQAGHTKGVPVRCMVYCAVDPYQSRPVQAGVSKE